MIGSVGRILVGVDESANARQALQWAVSLARRLGAEVVAVHAVGLLAHLGEGPPVPSQSHLDELRTTFESEWCAPLTSSGVPYRLLCLDGPPAQVLLSAMESEEADLVVVGSRGEAGHAEIQLGSTSHHVAQHSTRPVLIVPPDHRP